MPMLVYSDFVLVVSDITMSARNTPAAVAEYLSCGLGGKWDLSELKTSSS